ncbi:hypothetical protein SAMN05444422_101756 [Halobiforma haloterrestris]|uniref:Uncharacterized protein n=1 Tax=Natronobacterium haloterrestre TaxID=148448 RepID=A0A1I1DR23_NATHA|nr:hypothetical protein [Halobiforma haloterrestris]SFB75488.1 hypothetical protein SAMN05444422_101756 [Halobiforma haloterrestris]
MGAPAGTATATVTRWSRLFVATGVGFFVAWQLAALAGYPRSATVVLGVNGFVLHVVFGKAYALIPSYFARELAVPTAVVIHLPLAALGTVGAFLGAAGVGPPILEVTGLALWLGGCLVFVGALGWTISDNLTGSETGTGSANAHRRPVDRIANGAVPFVLAYLLAGSSLALVGALGLEGGFPAFVPAGPGVTHLLAAGTAALLVFAVGFRLLPRLLVVSPSRPLVVTVLATGVVGPALLAADLHGGWLFRAGATLLATALVGFAAAYGDMYRRSDRPRVGGRTVLVAAAFAVLAALLGLSFALGPDLGAGAAAFDAHYRLAVGGFLGLTVVGVTYYFYPPGIATTRFVDDRTAGTAVVALAVGLTLEAGGLLSGAGGSGTALAVSLGRTLSTVGAVLYATVVGTVFLERGLT